MIKKLGNKTYTVLREGIHKVTGEKVFLLKDEKNGKEYYWLEDEKTLVENK